MCILMMDVFQKSDMSLSTAALRLMLSMARIVHRNDAAVSLMRSLEFDPFKVEVEDSETDNLRYIKRELALMLESTSMV